MQGNFSLQHSDMALVSRPAHKITMGQHFKTDVMRAVSIKEGWLPRLMFFNSVYFNMWILLCLIQIFYCFTIMLYINHYNTIQSVTTGTPHLWNTTAVKQVLFPMWYNSTLDIECISPHRLRVDWTHQLCLCGHQRCELLKVRASHLPGRNQ